MVDKRQEALDSKINPSGLNEDQVVKDLLDKNFASKSNLEVADIALALQRVLDGQNSLLELTKQNTAEGRKAREEIERFKERMDRVDKVLQAFDNDKEKFIQDVLNEARSKIATGSEKDRIIAKGSLDMQQAMKEAAAANAADLIRFHSEVPKMPKVMVVSPGQLEMVSVQGHLEAKLFREEVRIKDMVWYLDPGKPTMVPEIVAKELERRRLQEQETAERKALMAPMNMKAKEVAERQQEISRKYGSSMENVPVPEDI
jgi:DNA polymerase III delta prime subunit